MTTRFVNKRYGMGHLKPLAALIPAMVLLGCSQIPVYEKPQTDLPETWQVQNLQKVETVALEESLWWQRLSGDEALNELINEALQYNRDMALAQVRLTQARALLRQSQSGRFPELSVNGGLARTQSSDEAYPVGQGDTFGDFSLGALLNYEIDLWGRVEASIKQSEAAFKATQADQQSLALSLKAAVAKAYLNLMALNQNLALAQNTVKSRQETLELRQTQLEYGSVTPLTVYQAESELASVQIALHQLEEQIALQQNALAVLIGRSPKALLSLASQAPLSVSALTDVNTLPIPQNLPSDLLDRRPDIQAAEQRLMAANANIGVAKAALFPKISLTGLLGFQSESLSRLFEEGAIGWNAAANINAPIFDYDRRRSEVKITEAEQQAMLIDYRQTVRVAFKEVLDATTQFESSQKQLEAQQRQVSALYQTLSLAQDRFDAGYSSYLEVLDAQRNLFNAELAQVNMKLNHATALVNLYKALGGDWQAKAE